MPTLPEFRLETFFSRWEFRARHHLTASDAETMPMRELLALADDGERAAWHELDLGYRPTYGDPALRAAIAATYERAEAADVLCFAGAQEGLACTVQAALEPGDHAVCVLPNYQSPEAIAGTIGTVSGVALDAADGFRLDVAAVEAALRPATRLVAVNFPNNPSGAVCPPEVLAALAALCEERGLVLLSDEVYRGVEQDPARTLPQAADLSSTAVSVGVLSKAYGLPGLRIGWAVCRDRTLLERMERVKHYGSICNAGPSEVLARIAVRNRATLLDRTRALVRVNLATFDAFFADHADRIAWEHPQGGCVCFPRYLGEEGAERFCAELLEAAGVLLLPPSVYASPLADVPQDRFRIGVGRRDPEPALAALGAFLNR